MGNKSSAASSDDGAEEQREKLKMAVILNQEQTVKELLDKQTSNLIWQKGISILHIAARNGKSVVHPLPVKVSVLVLQAIW